MNLKKLFKVSGIHGNNLIQLMGVVEFLDGDGILGISEEELYCGNSHSMSIYVVPSV